MSDEIKLKRKKEQNFHLVGVTGFLFFVSLITSIILTIVHAVKSESFFVLNNFAITALISIFVFAVSLTLFIIANILHDKSVKEWQEKGDNTCKNCGANFEKNRFDTETICDYCGSRFY